MGRNMNRNHQVECFHIVSMLIMELNGSMYLPLNNLRQFKTILFLDLSVVTKPASQPLISATLASSSGLLLPSSLVNNAECMYYCEE